jgi:hypothetical protein
VESDSRSQIHQLISSNTKVQIKKFRIIKSNSLKKRLYDKKKYKTQLSSHKNNKKGIIVSKVQAQEKNI